MREEDVHKRNVLGYGLVQPLRRTAGSDFATGEGEMLVRSCLVQILGTHPGEIPWNPAFGIDLERFRHRNAVASVSQDIATEIIQAIQQHEPRITIGQCSATIKEGVIYCKIQWAVVTSASQGSNVLIGPVTQEVPI